MGKLAHFQATLAILLICVATLTSAASTDSKGVPGNRTSLKEARSGENNDARVVHFESTEPLDHKVLGRKIRGLLSATSNSSSKASKTSSTAQSKISCGKDAIIATVTKFNNFRFPNNCTSLDPSLGNDQRCHCIWHRYAFTNLCDSDCIAARWRNCDLYWIKADKSPFKKTRSSRNPFSDKLHECCSYRSQGQGRICRLNVSPWGSAGVQIKKGYTVYFWFCTSNPVTYLVPNLFVFKNGVRYRETPPFKFASPPNYKWFFDSQAREFIPPSRFRDWPGFPFPISPQAPEMPEYTNPGYFEPNPWPDSYLLYEPGVDY